MQPVEKLQTQMRLLHWFTSIEESNLDARLHVVLKALLEALDSDAAAISRVEEGNTRVNHFAGVFPTSDAEQLVSQSYDDIALTEGTPVVAIDELSSSRHRVHPAFLRLGFEAYIGAPILVSGQTWGILGIYGIERRTIPFDDHDTTFIELVAKWLGRELERETAKRYRHLFEHALEAIYITSPAGIIVDANPSMATMLHVDDLSDLKQRNVSDFYVDPVDRQQFLESIQRDGKVDGAETRLRRADGEPFIAKDRAHGCFDGDGRLLHIEGRLTDITRRKEAEVRLRSREKQYRELIHSTSAILWEGDAQTFSFTFVSEEAEALLGYSCSQWLEDPSFWVNHIHPEDREWAPNYCAIATSELRRHTFDYRMIAADGRTVWLRDVVNVLSKNGKATRLIGVMIDITEQKQAEEQRREVEATYRGLVEQSLTGIYIIQDGRFAYVNPKLAEIFGYTPEEIVPHLTVADLVADSDRAIVLENIRRRIAAETEAIRYAFRGQRKDGRIIHVEVYGARGQYHGRPAVIGTLLDITDQKLAEQALREAEAKFRGLVEQSLTGIYIVQDEHFRYVNPRLAELFGYSREELVQRTSVADLVHEEDLPTVLKNLRLRYENEVEVMRYSFRIRRKDGAIRHVEVHSLHTEYEGLPGIIGTLLDVTDAKEAEERLLRRKERYRTLFENAPVSIWEEDFSAVKTYLDELFEGREDDPATFLSDHLEHVEACTRLVEVIDVNQATLALHGADDKDTLLGYLGDTFVEASYDALRAEMVAICRGEVHLQMEATVKTLRGVERQVVLGWSVSPGYEETYGRVLVTMLDITERKHAETMATENEARLRLALSAGQGGTFFCDLYPNETRWDERTQQIFGIHMPDGLVDYQTWVKRVHPDDREEVATAYAHALAHDQEFDLSYRIIRPDGELRYIRARGNVVRDGEGESEKIYGLHLDVTDQKLAELKLRDSLGLNKLLLETMLDGYILAGPDGRIVDVNPAYCRKVRYTREELLGMNITELDANFSPEEAAHQIQTVMETGSARFQSKHRRKDGTVIDLDASLVAVRSGEKSLVAGFVRNITEQKRIEREREKLIVELEAQNAELERFTYTVSHDLKSPLVTIQGFLGFLRKDATSGNLDGMEHDLQHIQNAAKTMQALLNDLLELSRVGRLINTPEHIAMRDLVDETLSLVAGEIAEKDVTMSIDERLPNLFGDRDRLREVFQNLISNAVKFMGDQAKPEVTITASMTEEGVLCLVRDNGIGIPPAYHDKVFELFERLHRDIEGTGIGLALVKRIIELHGGRIWVESEGEGTGSTFYFTLPEVQKK